MRFGPKWKVFWPKMACVLGQNAEQARHDFFLYVIDVRSSLITSEIIL